VPKGPTRILRTTLSGTFNIKPLLLSTLSIMSYPNEPGLKWRPSCSPPLMFYGKSSLRISQLQRCSLARHKGKLSADPHNFQFPNVKRISSTAGFPSCSFSNVLAQGPSLVPLCGPPMPPILFFNTSHFPHPQPTIAVDPST